MISRHDLREGRGADLLITNHVMLELILTRFEDRGVFPFGQLSDLAFLVLDEIHRLGRPAELLKIASDHYADIRVLATGSSTLGASVKFRDTLVGRKAELWLTPMNEVDLEDFGRRDLSHRFIRGGLPPFFLAGEFPERDFQEWMDAYWAKDIQELFRIERRHSFQRFAELPDSINGAQAVQGREVALTTLYTAADQVTRLVPKDELARQILSAIDTYPVIQTTIVGPTGAGGTTQVIEF